MPQALFTNVIELKRSLSAPLRGVGSALCADGLDPAPTRTTRLWGLHAVNIRGSREGSAELAEAILYHGCTTRAATQRDRNPHHPATVSTESVSTTRVSGESVRSRE